MMRTFWILSFFLFNSLISTAQRNTIFGEFTVRDLIENGQDWKVGPEYTIEVSVDDSCQVVFLGQDDFRTTVC